MRVFVAGATGVIGRRLVPRLILAGHTVTAMTRNLDRAKGLASAGAKPVVRDVYDAEGLEETLRRAKPDVVIHQLTALPNAISPRKMETQLAENDRIRVEGTRNLVRAAVLAGARRIVTQIRVEGTRNLVRAAVLAGARRRDAEHCVRLYPRGRTREGRRSPVVAKRALALAA